MGGDVIGLVAVVLTCGIPLALMYTYYRVRKLRSEERLAAIARGVDIPMEPELNQAARSRRAQTPTAAPARANANAAARAEPPAPNTSTRLLARSSLFSSECSTPT